MNPNLAFYILQQCEDESAGAQATRILSTSVSVSWSLPGNGTTFYRGRALLSSQNVVSEPPPVVARNSSTVCF